MKESILVQRKIICNLYNIKLSIKKDNPLSIKKNQNLILINGQLQQTIIDARHRIKLKQKEG